MGHPDMPTARWRESASRCPYGHLWSAHGTPSTDRMMSVFLGMIVAFMFGMMVGKMKTTLMYSMGPGMGMRGPMGGPWMPKGMGMGGMREPGMHGPGMHGMGMGGMKHWPGCGCPEDPCRTKSAGGEGPEGEAT